MHYLTHKMLTGKKGLQSGNAVIRSGLLSLSDKWMEDPTKYKGMVEVSQSLLELEKKVYNDSGGGSKTKI